MNGHSGRLTTLAFIGILGALPVESVAQASGGTQTLTPVSVSGHRTPAVTGGAGTIAARMDSLPTPPAPTLDVAIRRLPFVLVRTNSRGEAELSIRGSESRTPTVLLDGLPLSLGWDSRTDPSLIPLSGVSTLRITRSTGSLLAGPNAVGGVIEIESARAGLTSRSLGFATGTDQFGSAVAAASFANPFSVGGNTLAVRMGGTFRNRPALARADGVVDPGAPDGERINSDSRETDVFASARFSSGRGTHLTASFSGYDAERGVQPELHVEAPRFWRYPNQQRTFAALSAGTGVRNSPWGQMTVDASIGLNDGKTEIEAFTDNTYSVLDAREKGAERTVVSRGIAAHSLPGGGTLKLGGSLAHIGYDETIDTDPTARYEQKLWSIGLESDIPVTSAISLAAGLALDGAENAETGGRTPLAPRDDWAGRLGVTASTGDIRFHGAASRRSRFPALRELYSGALGRYVPNPDLRPERLTIIEAGATLTRGALELQGVVFNQKNQDGIIRTTLPPPGREFFRVNRDEIRTTGLEAVAAWSRGPFSIVGDVLAQRVRVYDITAHDAQRKPEHVPEFRGTVGVVAPIIAGISGNAWLTQTGTQYCSHPDTGEQARLDGDSRIDLGADYGWRFGAGWFHQMRLSVAIDNVADATVFDQCGMPQPGRTLRAGLSVR